MTQKGSQRGVVLSSGDNWEMTSIKIFRQMCDYSFVFNEYYTLTIFLCA
jgi:hypothetical protein